MLRGRWVIVATVTFLLADVIVIAAIANTGAAKGRSCGGFSGYSGGGCTSDLGVTNTDAPDPVSVGQDLFYLVEVKNGGPDEAFEVTIDDQLPATVVIAWIMLPVSPYGFCSSQGRSVFCTFYSLTYRQSAAVTIVTKPLLPGVVKNTATASSTSFDPHPGNNTRIQQTTINP